MSDQDLPGFLSHLSSSSIRVFFSLVCSYGLCTKIFCCLLILSLSRAGVLFRVSSYSIRFFSQFLLLCHLSALRSFVVFFSFYRVGSIACFVFFLIPEVWKKQASMATKLTLRSMSGKSSGKEAVGWYGESATTEVVRGERGTAVRMWEETSAYNIWIDSHAFQDPESRPRAPLYWSPLGEEPPSRFDLLAGIKEEPPSPQDHSNGKSSLTSVTAWLHDLHIGEAISENLESCSKPALLEDDPRTWGASLSWSHDFAIPNQKRDPLLNANQQHKDEAYSWAISASQTAMDIKWKWRECPRNSPNESMFSSDSLTHVEGPSEKYLGATTWSPHCLQDGNRLDSCSVLLERQDLGSPLTVADRELGKLATSSKHVEHMVVKQASHNLPSDEKSSVILPEALLYVMPYLSLQDILAMEMVCKSVREAIKNDELLWIRLHVEPPLSQKLMDEALVHLAARAKGRLHCLSLVECLRVSESTVERIVNDNPRLMKLSLPGCSRISAEAVVRMVKAHKDANSLGMPGIRQLRIRNIFGLTREHLDILLFLLGQGQKQRQCYTVTPQFYHGHLISNCNNDQRPIDVEACPKCGNARIVYDCPRERCQQKKESQLQQCRGCIFCIARCEECGRCISDNEYEETFCLDLLCSSCWLRLPKCAECNRPGCGRHADHFIRAPETTFVCGDCCGSSLGFSGPVFHPFV